GQAQQGDGGGQLAGDGQKAQGKTATAVAVAQHQHERPAYQRDDDRRNGEVLHPACHLRVSLPSTWSVPLKPREASRITRNSAVVAKAMTMAVRTSAWGSGSA